MRKGDDKLVIKGKGAVPELYNFEEDIGEQNDLANQYPEKVQQLDKLRKQWDSELVEPRFLGLIHTPEWQAKSKRTKKTKAAKEEGGKNWDWFAALDANKDGLVTEQEWTEFHKPEPHQLVYKPEEGYQIGNSRKMAFCPTANPLGSEPKNEASNKAKTKKKK